MLIGGLCNTFFLSAALLYWPVNDMSSVSVSTTQRIVEWIIYVWLLVIVTLHLIQLPIRFHIHMKCFASSRTLEVDNAVASWVDW